MSLFRKFSPSAISLVAAIGMTTAALAVNISGAGATFPFPLYSKWAAAYKGGTGNGLNYQQFGSGGGIKQIESKTVTFGAHYLYLTTTPFFNYLLVQFPTVLGS